MLWYKNNFPNWIKDTIDIGEDVEFKLRIETSPDVTITSVPGHFLDSVYSEFQTRLQMERDTSGGADLGGCPASR